MATLSRAAGLDLISSRDGHIDEELFAALVTAASSREG